MKLWSKQPAQKNPTRADPAPQEVDQILTDISRLYRELFNALYKGDQPTVNAINTQISALKAKLH